MDSNTVAKAIAFKKEPNPELVSLLSGIIREYEAWVHKAKHPLTQEQYIDKMPYYATAITNMVLKDVQEELAVLN